jgi:AraC-like DNA-binding protein
MSPPDLLPCGCPRAGSRAADAGAFEVRAGVYLPGCRAGLHHHPEARIVLPLADGFETRQGARRLAPRRCEGVYRPAGEAHVDRYAQPVACVALLLPAGATLPSGAFVARDPALDGIARALATEAAATDTAAPLVREGLALLASTLFLQHRTLAERGAPRWLAIVRERLAAADEIGGPAPSLAALAADVDRDAAHVAITFKRVYGCSVGTALRRLRLVRARACLAQEPCADLAAIAQRCGFADQSHFTRQFRALFGVTPGRYRARRQREAPAVGASSAS